MQDPDAMQKMMKKMGMNKQMKQMMSKGRK